MVMGINHTKMMEIFLSGHMEWFNGNLSVIMSVQLNNVNNGSYPFQYNFTFPDGPNGIALIPAVVNFVMNWTNGTDIKYHADPAGEITNNIIDPESWSTFIPHLVCTNETTFFFEFGGIHYNDALSDFDYAPINMNGMYVNVPVDFQYNVTPPP
jgi:hypothetical protein